MIGCVVLRLRNIWGRAAELRSTAHLSIGYARVSTKRQSLAAQIDSLRAARCDVVYTDKARGIDRHRRGLDVALHACRRGDQLIVWRLDRLARKTVHLIEIAEFLQRLGVSFRVLDGRGTHADFSHPEGRFVLAILGSFAELEHELTATRTRHALRSKAGSFPTRLQYELALAESESALAEQFCEASNICCLS